MITIIRAYIFQTTEHGVDKKKFKVYVGSYFHI